jgi:hypothetical protein
MLSHCSSSAFIATIGLLFAANNASGADAERGAALYTSGCGGCHSESVHSRTTRVAVDFIDVRKWVSRWNETLGLKWGESEIDDVTVHLNNTYYRFPCPPTVCKVLSQASGGRVVR